MFNYCQPVPSPTLDIVYGVLEGHVQGLEPSLSDLASAVARACCGKCWHVGKVFMSSAVASDVASNVASACRKHGALTKHSEPKQ